MRPSVCKQSGLTPRPSPRASRPSLGDIYALPSPFYDTETLRAQAMNIILDIVGIGLKFTKALAKRELGARFAADGGKNNLARMTAVQRATSTPSSRFAPPADLMAESATRPDPANAPSPQSLAARSFPSRDQRNSFPIGQSV